MLSPGTAGDRDGPGEGHVPVPHRDRAGGPEAGVTLLAPGAGQPAEGVDGPARIDRAGAGVGFAERCRIGMQETHEPISHHMTGIRS